MQFQQIRGATSIITYGRKKFLLDPFLAPKGACPPIPSPYNNFSNPLVELPLSISEIIAVDAVIVTHMHHFDHFDDHAAKALPKTMPMFVQSEKEAEDMKKLGFTNVTALADAGVTFDDVTLCRTEALHGDGVTAAYYYQKFGLPSEACGVVFRAAGEKVFYAAGDTLWYDGVRRAIEKYKPEVIALNAANAQMYDGTPILMGVEGVKEVAQAAPDAILIATHMDAVNHARVSREDLRKFAGGTELEQRLCIPDDGEILTL